MSFEYSLEKPTRVRFGVLGFLCTLALLLYVDRVCIGQAATAIQAQLKLNKGHMAWIHNAFMLAYCLFEMPMGHWGDRHGSRGVIARIVLWWSVFTALTGAAFGFWSLLIFRFLFGAGEAGAYPNTARVVSRWFPQEKRGFARGAIVFSSFVGASVSPVAAAYLIQRIGWRYTFVVFGAMGLVWAAAFYAWFRDDPATHPSTNAAERELIGAPPAAMPREHAPIPWKNVLASRSVWLLGTIMGVNSVLFYMLFQWYPTYLKEARGLSEIAAGCLSGAVMIGGAAGSVAGGILADRVLKMPGNRAWNQRLSGASALFISAASVVLVRFMPSSAGASSAAGTSICFAIALFGVQAGIPTWWAAVAQMSGRHGAAMWGLMNSLGGLGAMAATYLIGAHIDRSQAAGLMAMDAWQRVFDGVALTLATGAISWLAVRPTHSIVQSER